VIINSSGEILEEVGANPGPGTSSTKSSYSALLSHYVRQALGGS